MIFDGYTYKDQTSYPASPISPFLITSSCTARACPPTPWTIWTFAGPAGGGAWNMLPYSLKIVWFVLSLSGLLSCWAVLSAFAMELRSYWLPILYCIGCTILQGIFCLGLIWRMDPFLMPRSFCIAQTLLTGFASFLLTGVSATFTLGFSLAILKPGTWSLSAAKTSAWHPIYTLTLIIFPILASVAQIIAVFKLDAVRPFDTLVCDASNPEWVRFLGYAGTPLLFSIPFSCLALMAVIQMTRTGQRKANRSNSSGPALDINSTNLTSMPPRRGKRKDMGAMLGPPNSPTPVPTPRALPSPSPSAVYATFPGRTPVSPELTSPVSARQFHLPFSPLVHDDNDQLGSCHSSTLDDQDEVESFVSSAFPTFAPPSHSVTPPNPRDSPSDDIFSYYLHGHSTHRDSLAAPAHEQQRYSPTTGWDWYEQNDNWKWSQHENGTQSQDHDLDMNLHGDDDLQAESVRSLGKNARNHGFGDSKQGDVETVEDIRTVEDHSNFLYITRSLHANSPMMSSPLGERSRHLSTSSSYSQAETQVNTATGIIQSAVWRIIIFQLSFTLILILASLSTLIDVITHRIQPSPFGTQHVALLLAAWAPVFIFGSIPSTRRKLMFWKRSRSPTVLGLINL